MQTSPISLGLRGGRSIECLGQVECGLASCSCSHLLLLLLLLLLLIIGDGFVVAIDDVNVTVL